MKYYFIVNKTDLTQDMIDRACQNNAYTLRHNSDGTKVLLKYDLNKIPLAIYQLNCVYYSLEQILIESAKPEWDVPLT